MTPDLLSIVAQYRAGLEAEMTLLRRLAALSTEQRQASLDGEFAALSPINEARDATLASLVAVEQEMRPFRERLLDERLRLARLPEFQEIVALHQQASEMVSTILATDRESLQVLQNAEAARREATAATEKGETTLAAYRRVIAPHVSSPTLVNRRG